MRHKIYPNDRLRPVAFNLIQEDYMDSDDIHLSIEAAALSTVCCNHSPGLASGGRKYASSRAKVDGKILTNGAATCLGNRSLT